ncbi:hypothetical protein MTR_4g009693 [Medicago truncatula]|uniref:Uncharacterized protein n=1 Tax=Medicago truncatula TaxID=3880 RepID=A0A072US16_MEDTR|nr:hypothetical protein MTR_4g009693 [Medicago truncatula]
MDFHRWPFIDKGFIENFQGLYERSMRMEPLYEFRSQKHQFLLKQVGIYLPQSIFSSDQLYFAMPRVTSRKGLKILLINEEGEDTHVTSNVVYKEVFQNIW